MGRDIKLSGSEISVLKSIGMSGTPTDGKFLFDQIEDVEKAEFLEILNDLIAIEHVVADRLSVRSIEEAERASFRISPEHERDLRDAMNPAKKRDEERARRERRG